jgi:omega-amidase
VKVAAAQINCTSGEIGANVKKIREFTARAKKSGAELIVFPEMSDTGYAAEAIRKHATSWNEGAVPRLEQIAEEFSINLVCGVSEREDDRIYNTQVFIDASGNVATKYRKTHLIVAAPFNEKEIFAAGDAVTAHKIDNYNFGLTICYDLRFPEIFRKLALEHGTNVFLNSSAWPIVRVEHLRTLALARAIENQSYFVMANRVRTDGGGMLCGTSAIIDPYGVILAAASVDREEIIYADIAKEVVDLTRERMRVFEHRRAELY